MYTKKHVQKANSEKLHKMHENAHKKRTMKSDESAIMQHDNAGAIWTAPGISKHDTRAADQEPPAARCREFINTITRA